MRNATGASNQPAQTLYQIEVRLVSHHLETGMGDLLHLRLNCRDNLRVIVADIHYTDATNEVQVTLTTHIPYLGP
ncbi:hypothetical protein D3C78_1529520 [compost metagenome]